MFRKPARRPRARSADSACHTQPRPGRLRLRLTLFSVIAIAVIGTAAWLAWPRTIKTAAADRTVTVTMAGFDPPRITIPAGRAVTLALVNPDSPHHADGGGVHQFAVPDLALDVKVGPQSSTTVSIPAPAAGTYSFYCDVCCGGKQNPSMQGKLVVS